MAVRPLIEPFNARVLRPEWAAKVISPPYDSMSEAQRERWAAEHPDSFLHVVSGAALTLDHPSEHFAAALRGKAALARLLDGGAYGEPTPPGLFAQQITIEGFTQQAVLGAVKLDDVDLRAHEATHPARVKGLATHFAHVGCMASPVVVTPRRDSAAAEVVGAVLRAALDAAPGEASGDLSGDQIGEQLLDVTTADGARLRVVTLDAALADGDLAGEGLAVDGPLYIIDGHHRVAAGAQAGFERLFVAVIPPEQVTLKGFERTVSVLEVMPRRLLAQMSQWCEIAEVRSRAEAQPTEPGTLGVRLADRWYRAVRRTPPSAPSDSDVAFVHDVLLVELFEITLQTDDRLGYRITFGSRSASPEPPVEILLAPVSLDDIYAVADAGGTMPPKSTYFLPKARSGVVLMGS